MDRRTRIIDTFGPIELIGVSLFGNPETTSFHNAWDYFGEIADSESISRIGKDLYGLQLYHPEFPKRFEMIYMACIERLPNREIPIRMVSKVIPKCKYVVQKVVGGINGIDQTIMYLYQHFIPENNFKVAYPLDFERYFNVKDHDSVPNGIEIWIPIK